MMSHNDKSPSSYKEKLKSNFHLVSPDIVLLILADIMEPEDNNQTISRYRKSSLRILFSLLTIWFVVSFGCGILFREQLDAVSALSIGNAPFGFWMAQQGSIICFIFILIVYAFAMNRLDVKHGYSETSNKKGK